MQKRENPYTPGAGRKPPNLAGRERGLENFQSLIERLASGGYERSLIYSGLRGVGKTVLLMELDADDTAYAQGLEASLRMRLSHAYLMDDDSPSALAHAVLFRQWGITPDILATELAVTRALSTALARCPAEIAATTDAVDRADQSVYVRYHRGASFDPSVAPNRTIASPMRFPSARGVVPTSVASSGS